MEEQASSSFYTKQPQLIEEKTLPAMVPLKLQGETFWEHLDTGAGRDFIYKDAAKTFKPIRYEARHSVTVVCGLTEIQKLQKLQNRAARIITGSNYDAPSKPPIETLGWRTIEKVIQRETRVMVFKSVNGLSPQYLSELFATCSTNNCYNLRHTTTDLRLPKKLSSNGQKAFHLGAQHCGTVCLQNQNRHPTS